MKRPAHRFAWLLLLTAGMFRAAAQETPRLRHVGFLEHRDLEEVSGLAASRRRVGLFWAVNDSGNPPDLFALGADGGHLGRFTVHSVENRDWEDLAAYRRDGVAYLLVADTGDNNAVREEVCLHVIREPELPRGMPPADGRLTPERTIRFRYEDGPRDVEAVAVDAGEDLVLLLSKRTVPPVLYELPLHPPAGEEPAVARRLAEVTGLPQPTAADLAEDREFGRFRSQPTAMDVAADRSAAVVLTYKNACLFSRAADETWADAFRKTPRILALPRLNQAESIALETGGRAFYFTSEQRPAPLLRVELPEEVAAP